MDTGSVLSPGGFVGEGVVGSGGGTVGGGRGGVVGRGGGGVVGGGGRGVVGGGGGVEGEEGTSHSGMSWSQTMGFPQSNLNPLVSTRHFSPGLVHFVLLVHLISALLPNQPMACWKERQGRSTT